MFIHRTLGLLSLGLCSVWFAFDNDLQTAQADLDVSTYEVSFSVNQKISNAPLILYTLLSILSYSADLRRLRKRLRAHSAA